MGYRNPAYLAKVAATVDVISGERAEMGIGAGWYEHEWRAYGYGFPGAGDRIGMLGEGVQIMHQLWTTGTATLDGKHYQVNGAICRPLPLPDDALGGAVCWYSVIHAAPGDLSAYLAEFARVSRPGGHLLVAFFEAVGEPVTRYEHTVTPAYRCPADDLSALAGRAGFTEIGRMAREPRDGERFRRGHLLMLR